MARLNKDNLFHSLGAIFGLLAFSFSFHAEGSCVSQLSYLNKLREDAVEKVASNTADSRTKVWLAYVESEKFQKSLSAIDHFSSLIMDSKNQSTPAFLRMVRHPLGVAALSKISGLDLKYHLKDKVTADLAELVLNGAIFRIFYFIEKEAVVPSQKVFEQLSLQLHQFAYRIELLKNLDLNIAKARNDVYKKELRRFFYSYVHGDHFEESLLPHERDIKNRTADFWEHISPARLGLSSQPLINLNTLIYAYKEFMPPAFARYRPLGALWEFFVNYRRNKYFVFYERELRVLMAAISSSENEKKAFYSADFFKSMDAFQIQFLVMATSEQKHLFRINMEHHFTELLKALSRESDGAIDGDIVSPKTFERMSHWCERLGIETPAYVYGNQLTDPE